MYNVNQHVGSFIVLSIFAMVSFALTLYSVHQGSCNMEQDSSIHVSLEVLLIVNCIAAPLTLGCALIYPDDPTSKSLFIHALGLFALVWNILTAVSLFKDNTSCSDTYMWQAGVAYYSAFLFLFPFESLWTINRSWGHVSNFMYTPTTTRHIIKASLPPLHASDSNKAYAQKRYNQMLYKQASEIDNL